MTENARFKDFDAATSEEAAEPLRFRLGGKEWTASHVSAGTFFAFVRQQAGGGHQAILAVEDFLASVLEESERADFLQTLVEANVPLRTMRDLAEWITEQAVGAPFADASSSPSPPSTTGARPRVVSLSGNRASRRSRRSVAG